MRRSARRRRNHRRQLREGGGADDSDNIEIEIPIPSAKSLRSLLTKLVIGVAAIYIYNFFPQFQSHQNQRKFVSWFIAKGGWMSPNIQLGSIEGYGNGLMAMGSKQKKAVQEGDLILKVPKELQLTAEMSLARFRQLSSSNTETISNSIVSNFPNHLEQQDVWIALLLIMECSLGTASTFKPFLNILPPDIVPRLDTFHDEELELLQDDSLAAMARDSKQSLQTCFDQIQQDVQHLCQATAALQGIETNGSCISFSEFHRFVSIASSHAMILDNTKFLVPMADMINHSPSSATTSFADHHVITQQGQISVHADRTTKGESQIFEEYGKLDNSLYLLAHGFVPQDNPDHCVVLSNLPTVSSIQLKQALTLIGIAPDIVHNGICVRQDGSILDDNDETVSTYLAVASLEASSPSLLKKCLEAVENQHNEVRAHCANYQGHKYFVAKTIASSAALEISTRPTTLAQDLALVKEYQDTKREQARLALAFRISDKQLLQKLASR